MSLEKWSNREIATKTEAEAVFDDLKKAVRAGTFEKRRAEPERKATALTFRRFAEIADLKKPRIAGRRKTPRVLAPASINRTIEILRHMMNWAVEREYIGRTPFRRGTETLIRKLREDNPAPPPNLGG